METSNNKRNLIICIVVAALLLIGAYAFDHRNSKVDDSMNASSTSDLSLATSTISTTTSPTASQPTLNTSIGGKTGSGSSAKEGYIKLPSITLVAKSNTSNWQTYINDLYKFTLSYPQGGDVRKFIGGKNDEYGIGLTYVQPSARFTEKYFELTVDQGTTTMCDALLEEGTFAETAQVGKTTFIRREYNDGTSHVVEYTSKSGQLCYRGYLRLNNPSTGTASAPAGDSTTKSEMQLLEDIMSTFTLRK